MNCAWMDTNLVTYLDGKAGPAARREAETHLAECAPCRERAEQFRALWSVLEEAPAPALSASFDAEVRGRIAVEPRRADLWAWLTPSPRMAAAVAALVVFSVWLSSIPPGGQPFVEQAAQIGQSAQIAQPAEAEFGMIQDLPVLEDYDVLSNFDALSELPMQQGAVKANP